MLALLHKDFKAALLNMCEDLKENMIITEEENLRIEMETIKKDQVAILNWKAQCMKWNIHLLGLRVDCRFFKFLFKNQGRL